MPTQPDFISELLKLMPIVLGGVLAIAGGAIGQVLSHRYSAKRDHAKLVREKGEALCRELHAAADWLGVRMTKMVFERGERHDAPNPYNSARALQAIYFPELQEAVEKFGTKMSEAIEAIGDSATRVTLAHRDEQVAEAYYKAERNEGNQKAVIAAIENRTAVLTSASDGARKAVVDAMPALHDAIAEVANAVDLRTR